MPRSIVMGNGNMLTALDNKNMLEDFYFPYVGMEDHIAFQHFHRIGVFTDNRFSWLYEKEWQAESSYIEESLVTNAVSRNERLQLELHFNDFVYPFENFLMRKITIENKADYKRDLKLFFGQDFHLYGDKQLDTAFYEPENKAVVHFRKRRYFWISGLVDDREGVDSFTTGKSEYRGLEGTWRDAEDGELHEHGIEQGSVDSTVQFNVSVEANSKTVLYFWICAGKDLQEVERMHRLIVAEGPETLLRNTVNYWNSWVNKDQRKYLKINRKMANALKQSLMIVRTQIDNRGGILAANDSDIMKFNKDTYSYVWPRDGAWVVMGLDRAGYGETSKRFFEFCADVLTDEGYLLPKYNADRSVGSSWHPWYKDGKEQLPIQEDETALVLHALWSHFTYFKDIEFLQKMYYPLIRPAGNFLAKFIDKKTGLPLPSYDLWERDRGIFSYTAATVYAGLTAASQLCNVLGHFHHRERYEENAETVKKATLKHLYDEKLGRFLKRIEIDEESGEIKKDEVVDASLHGLWMMGVLPPDDPRIVRTNEIIFDTLSIPTEVGGLTRSEHDDYQRVNANYGNIEGNPWIITTLWHAQWLMAKATQKKELKEVEKWLDWTMEKMNPAGILPEQLNPFNGDHLSVAPLTWSHSTFIDTVLQYEEKMAELS